MYKGDSICLGVHILGWWSFVPKRLIGLEKEFFPFICQTFFFHFSRFLCHFFGSPKKYSPKTRPENSLLKAKLIFFDKQQEHDEKPGPKMQHCCYYTGFWYLLFKPYLSLLGPMTNKKQMIAFWDECSRKNNEKWKKCVLNCRVLFNEIAT